MKKHLLMSTVITLAMSAVGIILQIWLRATGFDGKGLLVESHPAVWLLYLVSAATVAAVIYLVRPLNVQIRYHRSFPASSVAALGSGIAAVCIAITTFRLWQSAQSRLDHIFCLFGLLSTGCFAFIALCRYWRKRPSFLLQAAITIFFLLFLYTQYQIWSAEAQLPLYLFPLLAVISTILASYHRCALDGGLPGIRRFLFFGLISMYFNCIVLPGSRYPLLHLGMAIYSAAELISLRLPRHPAPAGTEEGKE